MRKHLVAAAIALAFPLAAGPASAQSSFQYSCSNYGFVYSGAAAALHATCLTGNGTPKDTTLILTGIIVENGALMNANSSQPSTFQKFCGSINIYAEGPYVMLSATCAMSNGQPNETSIQLDNISNNNGNLVQGN